MVIKLFLLTILSFLSLSSFSQTTNSIDFTWSTPTQRENGDLLDASEIASYTICYAVDLQTQLNKNNGACVDKNPDSPNETVNLNLQPRVSSYVINAGVYVTDVYGIESNMSAIVSINILVSPSSNPNPPNNVQFNINCENCVVN